MAQDTFFFSLGPGLAWFLCISSCLHPRAVAWVIGPLNCGTDKTVVFSLSFLFRPADPPPPGAGGDLGTYFGCSNCGTGLCDFMFSLFRWNDFVSSPLLTLWRYFGFPLFRRHILAPPSLSGDMTVVFFDVFPVPYG